MKEIESYKKQIKSKEDSSLKRIGNFIKEARIGRNQSIEELASELKIGEHQLKAIEDGIHEDLPEEVFIKAMIRRISDKLKLDTKFVMEEFNNERKVVETKKVLRKSKEKKQKKIKNPFGFGIFLIISGFFGILASSLFFDVFLESFQNQSPKQEFINKKLDNF